VTHFLNWLNFQLAGQEPAGYHAVNLILHLAAALLAYECLRRLLPPAAALVAAGIFAVHPLQAEAVDYVAARGVMVAAALCFAALWAWMEGRPWIAVAAFAGALLADERSAAFPAVWLMLRWGGLLGGPPCPGRLQGPAATSRSSRTCAAGGAGPEGIPDEGVRDTMALALAFMMAIAAAVRAHTGSYVYALVVLRFLRLFAIPWGFTIAPDVHEPLWLAVAAAIGVAGMAVWRWRKLSVPSELSWMLLGLVLLIPDFSANPAADPSAYLPLFAFAAAAGLLLARVPALVGGTAGGFGGGSDTDSMSARVPAPAGGTAGEFGGGSNTDYTLARAPALAGGTAGAAGATAADRQPAKHAASLRNPVGIGAIIILAAVSLSRTYVWMSDERLWREAVRRAPDLVEPKIQLAKSLRAADALELLNRARQQAPYNREIPAEIGKVLLDEQQYEGAVEELSRAVALNPGNALAFNNRGVALAALGQSPAAEADFRHALALDPKLAEASENLKRLGAR
jgi:hypothetical protein